LATLKDIAKKANVSISTVSRILNNDQSLSVKDETRERVYQIKKELNYQFIKRGRYEKKQVKDNDVCHIGIILCQTLEEEMADTYFLSIRQGIEKECKEHDFIKSRIHRWKDIRLENTLNNYDGLIIVGGLTAKALGLMSDHQDNVVFINHQPEDEYDSVVVDFSKATETALYHLINKGKKQIGYIGGTEKKHHKEGLIEIVDQRLATYKKVMKQEGLYYKDSYYVGEYTLSDGYELMKKAILSGNLPEAFFIASDPMAIGAMHALNEYGIRIPHDVAIVSFNDVDLAKFSSPPLTSVKVHTNEMGRTGVKLLIDRLKGRTMPLKVVVPTELSIRKSCGGK